MYMFPEIGRSYTPAAVSHFEYKIAISSGTSVLMKKSRIGDYTFYVEKDSVATIRRFLVTVQGEQIEIASKEFPLNKDVTPFFESEMYESRSDVTKGKMVKQHERLNRYFDEIATLNRKINAAVPEWNDPEDEDGDTPAVVELKERRAALTESVEKIKNRFMGESTRSEGELKSIKDIESEMTEELKAVYLEFFYSQEMEQEEEEAVIEDTESFIPEEVSEFTEPSDSEKEAETVIEEEEGDSDFSDDLDSDDGQEVITA